MNTQPSARQGPTCHRARRAWLQRAGLSAFGLAGLSPPAAAVLPEAMRDVTLVHRDGRSVSWRRDVIGDRIVVVNFVYTSCTSLCPSLSAVMAGLQASLPPARRRQLSLVSLSVDPLSDTPQRLDAFARRFDAGPGWWWLTGEARVVHALLDELDAGVGSDPQSHAPLWLAGRAGRGPWRRLIGMPGPAQFEAQLEALS